ncbi:MULTISPECIES: ABC transporter substrate-binding protein [unclassified Pseudodesulfovibrio]|uniref:ABC transporter substrate-binding protein n=1 Tax=unclassified Pseudodesulfovibrio TaxID=2661612 RepID=UPI000FEB5DCC|nr:MULTISPECIES: ABC transporter substrate-binding protein [unclassified Pseudodesulfovibrio]MCJ2163355.1 ABC transporter substrate-binding protein [Pseudodesulfovibrio sp. S3-i]RWU06594.1 ABC transporter substrate-binding protein [Pseudodesulfovibrio sp. S3]
MIYEKYLHKFGDIDRKIELTFNKEKAVSSYTLKKQMLLAVMVCVSVFVFSGVAFARDITDMTGRVVSVPDAVKTVYAASPPETMLVYAIDPTLLAGLNFPLKGCDKYIDAHTLDLPVIGGYFGQGKTPNLEKLVALNPDIVVGRNSSPLSHKFEAFLGKFNIPIANIVIDQLYQYPDAFEALGGILGREARGRALADYTRAVFSQVAEKTALISPQKRVKVYYAEGNDGLRTEGSTSIHAELIPLAGGINVHGEGVVTRYGKERVNMETVIAYQPEVIFVEQASFYAQIYSSAGWKSIPAVKNHRVYLIPNKPFNWFDRPPSFMRILGLKWVANIMYPDLFDWDMQHECREFFHLFLQKDISSEDAEQLMSSAR